uniref:HNHc domain-containing protein n=1 Tax=Macrostomum lignano TaxID=282301 RepID=A0A1I8JFU5_9PLAT
ISMGWGSVGFLDFYLNKQLVMESLVKVRQIELPSDTENPGSFKCFMNRYKTSVTVKIGNKDPIEARTHQMDSGLLWLIAPDRGGANQLAPLCRSLEFESLFCQMYKGEKIPLTAEEARILLAVPIHKRYDFCVSSNFQLAQRFQVGSIVSVRDPSFVENLEATNSLKCEVRFKGVLPSWTKPKDPDGLYFGFVSCDRKVDDGQPLIISVLPDDNTRQLLKVRPEEARDRRLILADARWLDPVQDCPADQLLNIDDRVVLQLDARQNEYRRGLIKWLGRLDANGPKHLAGVEFDHRVPNSSCWLGNRHMFEGKPECCLIVEEAHLQREKDFDRRLAESRANAGQSYQPPAQPLNSFDPRRDEAQALMESKGIRIDSHVNLTFLDKVGMVMWFGFIPNQTDLVVGVALDDNEGVERGGHGFVPSSQ